MHIYILSLISSGRRAWQAEHQGSPLWGLGCVYASIDIFPTGQEALLTISSCARKRWNQRAYHLPVGKWQLPYYESPINWWKSCLNFMDINVSWDEWEVIPRNDWQFRSQSLNGGIAFVFCFPADVINSRLLGIDGKGFPFTGSGCHQPVPTPTPPPLLFSLPVTKHLWI